MLRQLLIACIQLINLSSICTEYWNPQQSVNYSPFFLKITFITRFTFSQCKTAIKVSYFTLILVQVESGIVSYVHLHQYPFLLNHYADFKYIYAWIAISASSIIKFNSVLN
jgi:hypothetical protein